MKNNNILETIGNTPVVKINTLYGANKNVWIKLERTNPGNSIKDRMAVKMLEVSTYEQYGVHFSTFFSLFLLRFLPITHTQYLLHYSPLPHS